MQTPSVYPMLARTAIGALKMLPNGGKIATSSALIWMQPQGLARKAASGQASSQTAAALD